MATVSLKVGEVARFAYADGGTVHTIVSGMPGVPDGLFASAPFMDHGAFTCIRFDAPGTYPTTAIVTRPGKNAERSQSYLDWRQAQIKASSCSSTMLVMPSNSEMNSG